MTCTASVLSGVALPVAEKTAAFNAFIRLSDSSAGFAFSILPLILRGTTPSCNESISSFIESIIPRISVSCPCILPIVFSMFVSLLSCVPCSDLYTPIATVSAFV